MAKQIRLVDEAYDVLELIAQRASQPKSVCASLMVRLFDNLLQLEANKELNPKNIERIMWPFKEWNSPKSDSTRGVSDDALVDGEAD